MSRAVFFDGDSPEPHPVSLHVTDGTLYIRGVDTITRQWPVAHVRAQPDMAGRDSQMLRLRDEPLPRLFVTDRAVLSALPNLFHRDPSPGRARLAGWAVAAVAAVGLQILVLVPLLADNLAGFIPPAGERALGEATFGQIRQALDETGVDPLPLCEGSEGIAALEAVVEKLTRGQELRQDVRVFVLDHEMMNAFALPGSYVVLFRGLIEAAQGPDEVTSVLAHEIGHVVSADPTRHALRSAGSIGVLGLLFGDFAGGAVVLFLAERLIAAQYSQAAERAADVFAHEALENAGVDPAALGDLFATMRVKFGDTEGPVAHFTTHPSLGDRIAAAKAARRSDVVYGPSMSPNAWDAVQRVCD